MALSRRTLEAMGIEGGKLDQIIEMHLETVNGLKEKADTYKSDALKLPELAKKLEELESAQKNPDEYKEKYEQATTAFEDFKKNIEAEKVTSTKKSAYLKLLADTKIKENKRELILRTVKLDDLSLKDDNTFENQEELVKSVATDWNDFIEYEVVKGANIAQPPILELGSSNEKKEQLGRFTNALGIPELLKKE